MEYYTFAWCKDLRCYITPLHILYIHFRIMLVSHARSHRHRNRQQRRGHSIVNKYLYKFLIWISSCNVTHIHIRICWIHTSTYTHTHTHSDRNPNNKRAYKTGRRRRDLQSMCCGVFKTCKEVKIPFLYNMYVYASHTLYIYTYMSIYNMCI